MKNLCTSILIFALCAGLCSGAESVFRDIPMEEVQKAFNRPIPPHPRLFITDKQLTEIQTKIKSQPLMQVFYQAMLAKADDILEQPTVIRVKTGRRLLSVSRRCLDRVTHLSAAYRFTGKEVYLKRAEEEMLAAAEFSDWNPGHFLDVAEMTAALAIGYDWLYDSLPETTRQTIRQAILEKGLQPSLEKRMGWVRGHNNWNQVCNGGMTLGALAIMEEKPELAKKLVHRAINGVQVVMKHYNPDGAYPEGPGYWMYGTSYNVIFLAALESALGTDFNLSKASGFACTAAYYQHVTGPTGLYFNYPDSGLRGGFSPTVFWFAQKYNQPSLAWHQYQLWEDFSAHNPSSLVQSRFSPLVLLWCNGKQAIPKELNWMGQGSNPAAMFRSSWTDPKAVYLAIKGGSPGVSHGHMDVGSFVLDAEGVRWAADLGPESYHKIESRGMDLWSRSQDAERWRIFRYNNLSHNTLVVNGQHQRVEGNAPIIRYCDEKSFPHVVFDMSDVYKGQLAKALRGAALLPTKEVLIQDEIKATNQPATVRWAMVTGAQVFIENDKSALLKQEGKTMHFNVFSDQEVQLRTYSTEPKADYDEPNPGTCMIGFELFLLPGQAARLAVLMSPSSVKTKPSIYLKPVLEWSKP
ncbi:MAG: heparinase II/III family protein [Sedimentisphaerales bacterium]|nr:heparinase II/III family protein [Sedimentisphaerales bacterium]